MHSLLPYIPDQTTGAVPSIPPSCHLPCSRETK